jgi:hypothetical protein
MTQTDYSSKVVVAREVERELRVLEHAERSAGLKPIRMLSAKAVATQQHGIGCLPRCCNRMPTFFMGAVRRRPMSPSRGQPRGNDVREDRPGRKRAPLQNRHLLRPGRPGHHPANGQLWDRRAGWSSHGFQSVRDIHARMAVLRAIENGVALMRPTANGVGIATDATDER